MASTPTLSPDGSTIAISWRGDIWTVPIAGGAVTRITTHEGLDSFPQFSPDGKALAFCSDRTGSMQVYVVNASGGVPEQRTYHTEGYQLEAWYPDGKGFLVTARRDHFWRHSERVFRLDNKIDPKDQLLFNAYATQPAISPDGSKVIFIREGTPWWRKGYRGSQVGQLWLHDSAEHKYQKILQAESECRSPMWDPDGKTVYYLSSRSGSFNLWKHCLPTGKQDQLTSFADDSVVSPCISRDGKTIVFRHLFDLYSITTKGRHQPRLISVAYTGDQIHEPLKRLLVRKATHATFTRDGLEIAFIAGGDIWVMDTVLKEPRQVTRTPEEETEVIFSGDDKFLYYTSDAGGQPDIWRAAPKQSSQGWWQNSHFTLTKITDDAETEYGLAIKPGKPLLSFLKGRGDLWVVDPNGKNARRLLESWNSPDYDWSPDGKWLTFAVSDANFNRDVFVHEIGSDKPPFNISRHPDDDYAPVWSPNGKMIAFLGKRQGTEVDIYYVQLQARDSEESSRDRKLQEAKKKFNDARKKPTAKPATASKKPGALETGLQFLQQTLKATGAQKGTAQVPKEADPKQQLPAKPAEPKKPIPAKSSVRIDFDGIHDRIKPIRLPDSTESNLVWSPDSKRLAFSTTQQGKPATYTVSPPGDLKPKLFGPQVGRNPRWTRNGKELLWLVNSVPTMSAPGGKNTAYAFTCLQTVNVGAKHKAAFDQCWRSMRDYFYDGNLNNRDWTKIREKYAGIAEHSTSPTDLSRVISMMLGELNGSHLGFRASRPSSSSDSWKPVTAHLGVQFDGGFAEVGFKVAKVIHGGPASKVKSKLEPGDVVLAVDGKQMEAGTSIASAFTGLPNRDMELSVRNSAGKDRKVIIRPISYSSARSLLYEQWIRDNRSMVEKSSDGKLAYLHIQGMNMPSFYRFEQELYEIAGGKEGIVIDVRENGGGFTTDHLLTVLTQPVHAITVPRGGTAGYPQSRRIYATWNKPIIVLCNQNSFSNAEIFSHAIKTLKRGQLVGVPTSGSVISTGSRRIMDLGTLRMPFRGWYVAGTGEDMELNGAVPDHILWPKPGEIPAGTDVQLKKAVELLNEEVKNRNAEPETRLIKASER